MQTLVDVPPLASKRTGEPELRTAVARSERGHCDVPKLDMREIGPDAYPPCDERGIIVVTSVWLAFYAVAAICQFVILRN
jgi:hypothetical protein